MKIRLIFLAVDPSDTDALYASKHNGFINFKKVQSDPQELAKLVSIDRFAADLQTGNVPNYSHIIFNQCNQMHGLARCPNLDRLIATGDARVGETVRQITTAIISPFENGSYRHQPTPAPIVHNSFTLLKDGEQMR